MPPTWRSASPTSTRPAPMRPIARPAWCAPRPATASRPVRPASLTAGRATSAGCRWLEAAGEHRILLRDGNTHARDRLGHEVRGCVSRFAPPADTERGSVLPIVALSMVAILMIAAIVIDLGYTRSDRNATRAAADAAATSGALTLNDSTRVRRLRGRILLRVQEPRRERALVGTDHERAAPWRDRATLVRRAPPASPWTTRSSKWTTPCSTATCSCRRPPSGATCHRRSTATSTGPV